MRGGMSGGRWDFGSISRTKAAPGAEGRNGGGGALNCASGFVDTRFMLTPRDGSTSWTPAELASRPEVGEFCRWLTTYVDTGEGRNELTVAATELVHLARALQVDAVTVVAAIELLGCPPLHVHDSLSGQRGDRYVEALAILVRRLFGGS